MPKDDEFLPLKRVVELAGVSRSTLWRVSRSGIDGFPKPEVRGRRLFWRRDDVALIKRCVEAFEGRSVFDRKKRRDRDRDQHAALAELKKTKSQRARRDKKVRPTQGDLFGTRVSE